MRTTAERRGMPDRGKAGNARCCPTDPANPRRGYPDRSTSGTARHLDTKAETRNRLRTVFSGSDLDMGGYAIVEVGDVDGVDVSELASIMNGAIVETINIDVIEDTGAVVLQLEKDGGGDLSVQFASHRYALDCTPPAEVTLTQGTDAAQQLNYVYVTESGGVLTLTASTTSFPATSYAPVAVVFVQTAASLATDGAFKVHAWTDHFSSLTENGHVAHINTKFRAQAASWGSGVAGSDLSSDQVSTTVGMIHQLHDHTMPAIAAGSPNWVVNDPDVAYTRITSLGSGGVDKLSDGTPLVNARYVNLVLWGVVSEKPADCKLFWNLPDGQYPTEANALADVGNTAQYAIPSAFTGTGFLIARYTLQYSTGGGGTFTQSQKVDLRGLVPSTSPGGGSGVSNWLNLTDTDPTTFVGNAGRAVVVNDIGAGDGDGLKFATAPFDDVEFTYNADGTVSGIAFTDSTRDLTFAYNADGTVLTIADDGTGDPPTNTKTFAYNADGSVDTITVT